jgi:hypothetical protein
VLILTTVMPLGAVATAAADAPTCARPDAPATPLQQPTPTPVLLADGTRATGEVGVAVTLDATGAVVDAHAQSGPAALRAGAEDTVRRTTFAPGKRDCAPVGGSYLYVVVYDDANARRIGTVAGPCTQPDQPPRTLRAALPVMPEIARTYGLTGIVRLDVSLDENSAITDVRVIDGPGVFRESALSAARRSVFATAVRNCVGVPGHYVFVVEYRRG